MSYFKTFISIFTIINMVSCGAIIHGTKQDVSITAPSDALVKVDGRSAKGSSVIKLERNKSYSVTMHRGGQQQVCGQITNSLSVGVVIADVFLGLVGVIVDAATGAWYNLEPEQVMCRE